MHRGLFVPLLAIGLTFASGASAGLAGAHPSGEHASVDSSGTQAGDWPDAALAVSATGPFSVVALAGQHTRPATVLVNPVRARLLKLLEGSMGMRIVDAARALGIAHQSAAYHLGILKDAGYVVTHGGTRARLFFAQGTKCAPGDRALLALTHQPTTLRVLAFVVENEPVIKRQVAGALGVVPNTAGWHVAKLVAAGLLVEQKARGVCLLQVDHARLRRFLELTGQPPAVVATTTPVERRGDRPPSWGP